MSESCLQHEWSLPALYEITKVFGERTIKGTAQLFSEILQKQHSRFPICIQNFVKECIPQITIGAPKQEEKSAWEYSAYCHFQILV